MKKFSRYDFIRQYLQDAISGKKNNLWGIILGNPDNLKKTLKIRISYYDYLQIETFIEDIIEWAELKNMYFPMELLIAITYKEFLKEIRGNVDVMDLSKKLAEKRRTLYPEESKVEYRYIAPNHLRRFEYQTPKKTPPMLEVTTEIEQKYIRRGETLLMTANHLNPQCGVKVEELISILIRDLVGEIESGRKVNIMETLLQKWLEKEKSPLF